MMMRHGYFKNCIELVRSIVRKFKRTSKLQEKSEELQKTAKQSPLNFVVIKEICVTLKSIKKSISETSGG